MSQFVIKNARLSASGVNKFIKLADLSVRGISAMLDNFSDELQERIATFAPSEEEERYYLSLPGNDYDLYKREGGFLYLREAIIMEEIDVIDDSDVISIALGNSDKINKEIGFSWWHGYGKFEGKEFRTTSDANAGEAWQNLLQMWEYGGQPFIITPRDPDDVLTIAKTGDEYIVVDSVTKMIPSMQPFNMYGAGMYYMYPTLLKRTRDKLKEVISWL